MKAGEFTNEENTALAGEGIKIKVNIGGEAEAKEIAINLNDSMTDIASKFSKLGLNANFDEKTGRFFISSTKDKSLCYL